MLKILQAGIKQSSWQNRPSTCSMQELSAQSRPAPPQALESLKLNRSCPMIPGSMLTKHRAGVAAGSEHWEQEEKGRQQLWEQHCPGWGQ